MLVDFSKSWMARTVSYILVRARRRRIWFWGAYRSRERMAMSSSCVQEMIAVVQVIRRLQRRGHEHDILRVLYSWLHNFMSGPGSARAVAKDALRRQVGAWGVGCCGFICIHLPPGVDCRVMHAERMSLCCFPFWQITATKDAVAEKVKMEGQVRKINTFMRQTSADMSLDDTTGCVPRVCL